MAILKHIASKSSNYGAALKYLVFEHDELYKVPVRDENVDSILETAKVQQRERQPRAKKRSYDMSL